MWIMIFPLLFICFSTTLGGRTNLKRDINSNDRIVAAVDQYVGVDLGLVQNAYPPSLEVYETPKAISGYSVLYNTLSEIPGHVNLPTGEIVVYLTSFAREDKNEGRVILYDDKKEKCGFAVLITTHGIWILKLGVNFGKRILRNLAEDDERNGFQPTAMDLAKSTGFQNLLKHWGTTTLRRFLTILRSEGGYVTDYWLIAKMTYLRKAENGVFFGALYYEIKRLAKLLKVMPQSGIPESVKLWTSGGVQPKITPAFISVVFYRKEMSAWNAMTFFGQELGIWYDSTRSDVEMANCDTNEMMSLWHDAIELYCDQEGVAWDLVLWTSGKINTPVLRGIDLQHTPDVLPRTDISNNQKTVNSAVVILLTTKGYWTVWIPGRLSVSDAIDRIIARLKYDLVHGLKGASGISIITVALCHYKNRKFSRGRFLGPLLQAMQSATKPIFNNKEVEETSVIAILDQQTETQQKIIFKSEMRQVEVKDSVGKLQAENGGSFEVWYNDKLQLHVGITDTQVNTYVDNTLKFNIRNSGR